MSRSLLSLTELAIFAVLKSLVPLFLGDDKDPHAARAAAHEALAAYNPQCLSDYVAAARIIGFSLGAVGATAKALDPDLPEERQYQYLTKATTVARFAQRAETALEKARKHRPAQPQSQSQPKLATPAAQPRPEIATARLSAHTATAQAANSPTATTQRATAQTASAQTASAQTASAQTASAQTASAQTVSAPMAVTQASTSRTPAPAQPWRQEISAKAAPLAASSSDAAIEALLDSVLGDLPPAPTRGAPAAKTASLRQSLLQGTAAIAAPATR